MNLFNIQLMVARDLVKDLGVQINTKSKLHNNSNVTKKANHLVTIIRETFQHFDKVMLIHLYKTSVLEYGNIIWGPQYVQDQQKIEKVQKRATNWSIIFRTINQLAYLNLPSLKYRRQHGGMIMTYQLLHNYWNIDMLLLITCQ